MIENRLVTPYEIRSYEFFRKFPAKMDRIQALRIYDRLIKKGDIAYGYDRDGNLLSEKGLRREAVYAYNGQNRMVYSEITSHAEKSRATSCYAYDALGRRTVSQDAGRSAMRTLYDGLGFEVLREGETFNDGSFTTRYSEGIQRQNNTGTEGSRYRWISEGAENVRARSLYEDGYGIAEGRFTGISVTLYGRGEAVAVSRGGAAYLGKDILGSVRSTTNEYGALEDRYEYDAFGKPYKGDLTTGMNLGYTGKPYDTATGLYNYGFRDYQPEVARFTTVDPIRDGANWFAYVNNDPVNWVDPWGLECTPSDKKDTQRPVTPIAQNDPLLSGIPKMSEYGCVFRTYQGVAENYTGLNLTAGEIVESVKTLQSTPNIANPTQMVVDKEMKVNNPDQVINNAFEILGQSGTTATVNWGAEKEQTPDYYRQVGTTPLGNEHSVLLDSNKNLITDPYDPNIPLTDTQAMPVYIHEPKKE